MGYHIALVDELKFQWVSSVRFSLNVRLNSIASEFKGRFGERNEDNACYTNASSIAL